MSKFYLEQIETSVSKTGNQFLKVHCTGTDKQRHLFYLWDSCATLLDYFNAGNLVAEFTVDGDPNFPKITAFGPSDGDVTEFYSFIYPSDDHAKKILDQLIGYTISDTVLRSVVKHVFSFPGPKPFATIYDAFLVIPAAKAYHHDYRYGLLQHTHQVMTFINRVSDAEMFSPFIDKQMALCAGLLHDVGKCYEYSFNGVSAEYGTNYEVNQIYLGSHLYKGAELVALAYSSVKQDLQNQYSPDTWAYYDAKIEHLKHCILAHHLQREWAAVPKQPQTLEAYLVFLADYFSAQFGKFTAIDWSECSIDNLFGATSRSDTFFGFNRLEKPVDSEHPVDQ